MRALIHSQENISTSRSVDSTTRSRSSSISGVDEWTWNDKRLEALGWDLVEIGAGGLALITPGVGEIAIAISILQITYAGVKLLVDTTSNDKTQQDVDKAYYLVLPAGEGAALLTALLGGNESDILSNAKASQLLWENLAGGRGFVQSRAKLDLAIPLLKDFAAWNSAPENQNDQNNNSHNSGSNSSIGDRLGGRPSSGVPRRESPGTVSVETPDFFFEKPHEFLHDPTKDAENFKEDFDHSESVDNVDYKNTGGGKDD